MLPPLGHPHHPGPEYETMNAEYDSDRANQLLDEIVPDRDDEGFRTLPDGERLEIVIHTTTAFGPWPDIAEQVARFWGAVGIRSRPDVQERSLNSERVGSNQVIANIFHNDDTNDVFARPLKMSPVGGSTFQPNFGPLWGLWWRTDGEEGMEPPADVKRIIEIVETGPTLPPEEANELAKELYRWHVENQVMIGVIGQSPAVMGVVVVSDGLGNVPATWASDIFFDTPFDAFPDQFYWK